MATVAGWGRTSFITTSSTTSSSSLQAAQVMVLTREECVDQPGSSAPLSDQLCAGVSGARQGPCPGDSGGPLLVPGQGGGGDWVVVGVVSHGPQELSSLLMSSSSLMLSSFLRSSSFLKGHNKTSVESVQLGTSLD